MKTTNETELRFIWAALRVVSMYCKLRSLAVSFDQPKFSWDIRESYFVVLDVAFVKSGCIEAFDFDEQTVTFKGEQYSILDVEPFLPRFPELDGVTFEPASDPELVMKRYYFNYSQGKSYTLQRVTQRGEKVEKELVIVRLLDDEALKPYTEQLMRELRQFVIDKTAGYVELYVNYAQKFVMGAKQERVKQDDKA